METIQKVRVYTRLLDYLTSTLLAVFYSKKMVLLLRKFSNDVLNFCHYLHRMRHGAWSIIFVVNGIYFGFLVNGGNR